MDDKTKQSVVEIFNKHILSPMLYMVEFEDVADLVCFCDRNIKAGDVFEAEKELLETTGMKFEIIDIREFDAAERLDIMQNAEIIYSADNIVEHIFERAMAEDYDNMIKEREAAMIRYEDNHSPFLQ